MKKASLPMINAIQARLTAATAKDKEGLAKIAIENAEKSFVKDCEAEIEILKDRKAILEQRKAEHVYEPSKSEVMELELNVKKAERAFEQAVEEAEETLVANLVAQAMTGSISKEVFRQLYRLKKRDITLEPLRRPAQILQYAEKNLEEVVEDTAVSYMDSEIEDIDKEIELLNDMLS